MFLGRARQVVQSTVTVTLDRRLEQAEFVSALDLVQLHDPETPLGVGVAVGASIF